VSLFIASRPSCGDETNTFSAQSKNYENNRVLDTTQNIPTLFVVVAGEVGLFKPSSILENQASSEKRNTVLAQVGLSFRGIPLVLHK
jgi:hypothetical protein